MKDKTFLQYALAQSFLHPHNNAAENVTLQHDATWSDAYTYTDRRHPDIIPYSLPFADARRYSKSVGYDIKHTPQLYVEYERYKHDLVENIIIPEKIPEVVKAREVLDLVTVNRQSAQKKKIAATLIPASFSLQLKKIHQQYQAVIYDANSELQKNQAAVDLSLINDFEQKYSICMRRLGLLHPFYHLNQKLMKYYLNEAAQILKSNHPLNEDFCLTHCFKTIKIFGKKINKVCPDILCGLVAQLKQMAHQPKLLTLVQALLVGHEKFDTALKKHISETDIKDAKRIADIRYNMQQLFNNYAFLCYLDGVRYAFENRYLNECPEPRHPPLPTVSPTEELKMVSKIVSESYLIDKSTGKVWQVYKDAFSDFGKKYNALRKLIFGND